ncbi:hypothetical protein TSOC_011626 [Tetrabaena socialis]|uniref:ADP-ribosylglycohydrolase n=1 Tax=Tetrabaena socialis TaxID=47790 RepID=A0A2J7ZQ53_9CHLO|nr:hypothetical protein TSOC_011626 [Tetrabaena socialis]|eukprot:PNH02400.1 hypothetical protein TSOC_011626 [Tetrabaena socialis]
MPCVVRRATGGLGDQGWEGDFDLLALKYGRHWKRAFGGVFAVHNGSFEKAVLANTNVGGENCHRGAALGAVMGAASGESGIPAHLITGLYAHDAIRAEIDAYVSALHPHLLGGGAAAAAATCAATPAGTTA